MASNKNQSTRQNWEKFWDDKQQVEDVYDNAERIVCRLKSNVDLKNKKILEVGAGTGRDSLMLHEAGATVYVLDYADNSLKIISRLCREKQLKIHLIQGDAFKLPIADDSFDIVFHQGLIEHFQDPLPILQENFRILKPGGMLLVDVPQRYHIYTIFKHILIFLNKWFAGWETEFTIGQLQALTKRVGFEVKQSYGEWMRPSLFYRLMRELLLQIRIKLPRYPKGPGFLHNWRTRTRQKMTTHTLALYTGIDIGVVGIKKIKT
ncbi:class I SAM-dependent methyltransferase [candidate division KSB1 bacterium]|nr:class I SAM-dependent methyltransferase [candidate division KSB1 bacterium]